MNVDLHLHEDEDGAAREVAELLAAAARSGAQIVLTGGSTPRRAYELAASLETNWSRAGVWWGDERCVPPADERSNYGMARVALLDRLDGAPAAVHRIRGEAAPASAAAEYDRELRGVTLDLLLLGLGPDGHVASLFPHSPALDVTDRLAVHTEAKLEPFVDRVSLTLPTLRGARDVVFLVAGASKADAARRAFAEEPGPETPASLARSESGRTTVVLDAAAAAHLPR